MCGTGRTDEFLWLSTEEANIRLPPIATRNCNIASKPLYFEKRCENLYPEGNEKMQRNAQFLADYLKTATGKDFSIEAGTEGLKNAIVLALGSEVENPEFLSVESHRSRCHDNCPYRSRSFLWYSDFA